MYTDEEMDKQSVKSDRDGETWETKQDKDRTHMDEENSENWRIIAGRGQHSLSIYILLNEVYQKVVSIRDALDDKTRELKQSSCRTATAVNKHLHFRVKKKPQATDYVYVLHIWNIFCGCRGCHRPEDAKITIFPSSARRQPSRCYYKRY